MVKMAKLTKMTKLTCWIRKRAIATFITDWTLLMDFLLKKLNWVLKRLDWKNWRRLEENFELTD